MMTSATLSACRRYRYELWREWEPHSRVCIIIGLNPSTADENADDPTIRRCINFAKGFGCGSLCMLNLFAFRATNPEDMKREADPVGPTNDGVLRTTCAATSREKIIIAAWGKHGSLNGRDQQVCQLLKKFKLHCLKLNGDGSPAHPLYLKSDSPLLPFPPRSQAFSEEAFWG